MLYAQSTSTVISGRYTFCQKTIIAKKYVPDTDRQRKRARQRESETETDRDRGRGREQQNKTDKPRYRETEKEEEKKKETQRGHTERKPSYILTRTENKQSEQKTSSGS